MTHYAVNLHRQPGDLEPGKLHGLINLHGDRQGVSMSVDGYRTGWRVNLSVDDAIELAIALASDEALAMAHIGIGRATVDTNHQAVTLAIKTPAAVMHTEMTLSDARELAQALTALIKLDE